MNNSLINRIIIVVISLLVFNCKNNFSDQDAELEKLKSWMTGSFSSQEQSVADTNYFDIRLEMIQIWENRKDGVWLYVEQAVAWSLDKPYRQRVYHLTKNVDGSFSSGVYSFDNPLRFAGVWKENQPLVELTLDSLIERTGCSIILELKEGIFEGSTVEKRCTSQLRGASYATSEVRIEEEYLTSWDRGFDKNGNQVWGAVSGPYIFKKLKKYN
jgi:CpeT protein